MKIISIGVRNFRLLKDFRVHLEDELSVVIGKNNTGKTSLLVALGKFLASGESRRLSFDDISTERRVFIRNLLTAENNVPDDQILFSVGLDLTIEYGGSDDLSTVAKLITSLDPADTRIVLDFRYELVGKRLNDLRSKWQENGGGDVGAADAFLRQNLVEAFGKLRRRSKSTVDGGYDIDLDSEKLSLDDVIAFKCVSARRDVTNKDTDQTLSAQAARIYRSLSGDSENEGPVEAFKTKLREADDSFSTVYADIFKDLITKVHDFGGVRVGESAIKIASTLQHRDILSGNTTVMYEQADYELPEHYNGLGYMNLISMIFEIDLLMKEFRKVQEGEGATLSLLFIEEPEAHTHPQMQYVFIKNIRKLLETAGESLPSLQTVLSTHSAHIVAQAEFDSIKYLQRSAQQVQAKNLRELEGHFSGDDVEERRFRFLKQYLTLHRAELFFADRVVLIEGDTERVLLPAMMRKLDQAGVPDDVAPLLSQNVSVVEVGAHSQIYEKFIDFLGLRTLIITDIDSGYADEDADGKKTTHTCCPDDKNAALTSNSSLLFYHGKERTDLDYFVNLGREGKTCSKQAGVWRPTANGDIFTAYQTAEAGYHGRSFEDAFFSLNKDLLRLGHDRFSSLTKKWYDKFMANEITPLVFAEQAVNSKPSLAIEVLLNSEKSPSGDAYGNWKTPAYIEEGLKWLRGDHDE